MERFFALSCASKIILQYGEGFFWAFSTRVLLRAFSVYDSHWQTYHNQKRRKLLKRNSRSIAATRMRKKRANERWEYVYKDFEEYSVSIKNSKGKTRFFEENEMLVLGMKAALKRRFDPTKVSWTSIDRDPLFTTHNFPFNLVVTDDIVTDVLWKETIHISSLSFYRLII